MLKFCCNVPILSYSILRILNLIFLTLLFGSNMVISKTLLVISNVAEFCTNFNLSIIVLNVFLSTTLIIANPDTPSINDMFTFINPCSFSFNTMSSFGKIGTDIFVKLKHQSHEFITPSNSNVFLIPKTKSTFHVFLIIRYIFQICVHVCLLLLVL